MATELRDAKFKSRAPVRCPTVGPRSESSLIYGSREVQSGPWRYGISGAQILTRRRLLNNCPLAAAAAGEEMVAASQYCALEVQVRESRRPLGKKAMETELLRRAVLKV